MAFRFWRRVKIAPGVTLNVSKSGGSLSFGPRGAKATVGSRGKRATVGLPGTGLFYTTGYQSGARSRKPGRASETAARVQAERRLSMGFFKRLFVSSEEEALVDGFRELARGNEERALERLKTASDFADGAFIAGFLSLKRKRLEEAEAFLKAAAARHNQLGRHFRKYGIAATLGVPITEEVTAQIEPCRRGVFLGLVEIYQLQERWNEAMQCLRQLLRLEPGDILVRLSLAELLFDSSSGDSAACKKVVELAENVENESALHAALLLYKARALRNLGLDTAARDVLSAILRRTKERPDELLRAARYERALAYEALGQRSRARTEFEKIYAEQPGYEDVAARLGL